MHSKVHLLLLISFLGCNNTRLKENVAETISITGHNNNYLYEHGAIVRGDTTSKIISLVFTGDEFADGGDFIRDALEKQQVKGAFFLTGKFYRNPEFATLIHRLISEGHYLGAHSDQHLLYCDWNNRNSLLVTQDQFIKDTENNFKAMKQFGIQKEDARFFLPPYEWYNDSISAWTLSMKLQLINFTHGTLSHTDYTLPNSPAYKSSECIYRSVIEYERTESAGLNGFILLSHIGAAPERTDNFHMYLEELIIELKSLGYQFARIDALIPVNFLPPLR